MNQIQFSAYEEMWGQLFAPLTKIGYNARIVGKELGQAHNYKLFLKYLPISDLNHGTFEAQREDILSFVDKCLNEIENPVELLK